VIFIVSFLAFAVILAAMAVGVIAGRAPISGSCGGVGRLGIDQKCELCGGDPQRCDSEAAKVTEGQSAVGVQSFDPRS